MFYLNRSQHKFIVLSILLSVGAAGFLALIGVFINYYPAGNDLWDNHYLAMAITFSDIKSMYDGFFPIGYSLLLKLLVGNHYPVVAAFYINVVLALLMMLAAAWYLSKKNLRFLFPVWLFLVIFFPQSFRYLITPGPDTAAAALFTIGILIQLAVYDSDKNPRISGMALVWGMARHTPTFMCVLSGIILGASALIRYHAFVASIFFLSAFFIFMKNGRKLTALSGITVCIAYLPQILVNVLSGHGPLETYHALNLYNLVYGVNWYHMEKLIPLPSAKSIILGAPVLFLKHYLVGCAKLAVFALPPIAYGFYAKPENKMSGYCVGAFCALYAFLFGTSASPRAALLLIPVSLLFFVKILFTSLLTPRIRITAVVVTMLCSCFFLFTDAKRVAFFKAKNESCRKIETFFVTQGVRNAQEIYTCDYDLFCKALFPYRPLFNGGWGRIAAYKYSEFYPELNVSSIDSFYIDCLQRKIRFVVFNGDAPKLADFCNSLYHGTLVDKRFVPEFSLDNEKIFRVF